MPSENHGLTPLPTPGLADYHCHCNYSIDADGGIEEYCEAALQRNLAEICFTTHYDTNPATSSTDAFIRIGGENRPATPVSLEPYVADVRRAHDRFYPMGLSVKLGIEIGGLLVHQDVRPVEGQNGHSRRNPIVTMVKFRGGIDHRSRTRILPLG